MAYESLAHELFYGGAAGAGKTGLAVGLALTQHHRSLLLRRQAVQVVEIVDQLKRFVGASGWRGMGHGGTMRLGHHVIEVGGCDHEDDWEKYAGRPHDLICFDEASHFSRSQFQKISAWNRHENPSQRCRIVLPGNPPTTPEARWIVEEFAPWIDSEYPDPARPGELRWYSVLAGELTWLDGPEPFDFQGEKITPRSRTFIPGRLADNPILAATDYGARLQALPEPLRSQLLYGDFSAGLEDDPWQVIPTAWVRAAMARWKESPPEEQGCLGVDVARGGKDKTVIAARHGLWFARLKKYPGAETPDGPSVASLVIQAHQGRCPVYIDVIGYGSSAYDYLKEQTWFQTIPVNNAEGSGMRDKSGRLKFMNVRAASYWKLREALDPSNEEKLFLPPDNELLADLCAPRYKLMTAGIQIEKKIDIIERIGRSPDCADAVVMAFWGRRPNEDRRILRVLSLGGSKNKGLHIYFGSREQLKAIITEERILLVVFDDPEEVMCSGPVREGVQGTESGRQHLCVDVAGEGAVARDGGSTSPESNLPGHSLNKILDLLSLSFADIAPEEHQEKWSDPVPPYGRSVAESIMRPEHGKKLWSFLLKKREPGPEVIIFCDNGDRRARSVAYAVADIMRFPRSTGVFNLAESHNKIADKDPAPNRHVYEVTKTSRGMVV